VFGEGVEEGADAVVDVGGRLEGDSADADVAGHHALAADGFEDAEQVFALAEAVEEDGEGADVHGVGAEPDEVRLDAGELIHQDADILRALGDLEAEEFFDRQGVGGVVGHRTEIVDAVGERRDLGVELGLGGLLNARVEIADVGGEGDDGLAVDLEDQAQDAVGRGMLRAHVEDHGLGVDGVGAAGVVVRGGLFDYILDVGDDEVFGVAEAGEGGSGGVGDGGCAGGSFVEAGLAGVFQGGVAH